MADQKIGSFYWEIDANTDKFKKGAKNSEKGVDSLSKKSVSAGKAIKAALSVVAVAGVVAFSKKIVSAALDAEKAYQVQESAITALNAALQATGQYSEETSTDIQAYASELQGLTTVGDEASIKLAQIAINAGLSAEQSKQATKDAIGLSKAFGIDLQAAIKATTNAQQGNYDLLNRYIPSVKNATDETQKQEEATKALAAAFEVAKAETQTSLGTQEQLQNAIGDSKELIGAYVAETLTPWRRSLLEIITEINNTRTAQQNLNKVIKGEGGSISQAFEEQRSKVEELRSAFIGMEQGERSARIQAMKLAREYGFRIQNLDDVIAREEQTLNVLGQKLRVEQTLTAQEKELAQSELDRLEAEQASSKQLSDYLELVDKEYYQTQQGKIELLSDEIKLWETYAETAVNTAPKVQAILEELKEEYESLTESDNENINNRISNEDMFLAAITDRAMRERELRTAQAQFESALLLQTLGAYTTFFGGLSELTSIWVGKNKEAFIANKAFSAAEAGINSYLAFTEALASVPWPFNLIAAAGVLASGLAQQIKIISTPVPNYETGGIVPGTSFTGDNVLANVNSGEMILNAEQQSRLFDLANGSGGSGPMTFILKLPDNTSVKWVVDAINSGRGGVIQGRVVK